MLGQWKFAIPERYVFGSMLQSINSLNIAFRNGLARICCQAISLSNDDNIQSVDAYELSFTDHY